ncbi:MAG TPA: ferritin-like domain-containing protein [Solirubrobacteraceae bacterium]|nr:ferritin-like domain-containing protein [Solirubrobacteraceae bacterium]
MVTHTGAATRRTLLKASVAGLGGIATAGLAGCGSTHRISAPPQARAHDAELLNGVLALEQRTIAAYTAAAPLLDGFGQKMAGQFLYQELLHAGILRNLVQGVGGHPHNPLGHYDFGHPRGRSRLLSLLHELEREQIAAYLHAIPRMSTPFLRQTLASVMANDAQHATVLRAQQGVTALSGPFLTSRE